MYGAAAILSGLCAISEAGRTSLIAPGGVSAKSFWESGKMYGLGARSSDPLCWFRCRRRHMSIKTTRAKQAILLTITPAMAAFDRRADDDEGETLPVGDEPCVVLSANCDALDAPSVDDEGRDDNGEALGAESPGLDVTVPVPTVT
jgi:hypothetical protein